MPIVTTEIEALIAAPMPKNIELEIFTELKSNLDQFKVANIPVFATNAAAITGLLVAGDIYRTATGQLMIVYTPA